MKKTVLAFTLFFCCGVLFATNLNSQKIYRTDCREFKAIESLYMLEGRALPSATGPWSADELLKMLQAVSRNTNSTVYDFVYNSLTKGGNISLGDKIEMSFGAVFDLSLYGHTDTSFSFVDDSLLRRPFVTGTWETWAKDHFYGFVSYDLVNCNYASLPTQKYDWNVWMLGRGTSGSIDQKTPFRAFASAGGDGWNFMLGRDRVSWGSGESGNLTVSDNMAYENLFKFATYSPRFKYTFLTSFYPHPIMWGNYNSEVPHADGIKGLFFYMAHRFETRFAQDRLALIVNEAIVYQNENGVVDLSVINPLMIFHNYGIKANANSTASVELSYATKKHRELYSQILIDDFTAPGELGEDTPNAVGLLAGIKSAKQFKNGILTYSAEAVYCDPYLYLRAKDGGAQNPGDYPLSYVGAISIGKYKDSEYEVNCLGYTYGNDLIGCNFKVQYEDFAKLSLYANAFMMIHGEHNIHSLFELGDKRLAPSGSEYVYEDFTLNAEYKITERLQAHVRFDFIKQNTEKDCQLVLGATYSF